MNYLVAYLPDPYLKEIAEYFAKQRPAFAPSAPTDVPQAAMRADRHWSQAAIPSRGFPRAPPATAPG